MSKFSNSFILKYYIVRFARQTSLRYVGKISKKKFLAPPLDQILDPLLQGTMIPDSFTVICDQGMILPVDLRVIQPVFQHVHVDRFYIVEGNRVITATHLALQKTKHPCKYIANVNPIKNLYTVSRRHTTGESKDHTGEKVCKQQNPSWL